MPIGEYNLDWNGSDFFLDLIKETEHLPVDDLLEFVEEPAQFVKCALATLPRELPIEGVASELSDEEIDAQIIWLREQLAKPETPLMIEAKAVEDVKVGCG